MGVMLHFRSPFVIPALHLRRYVGYVDNQEVGDVPRTDRRPARPDGDDQGRARFVLRSSHLVLLVLLLLGLMFTELTEQLLDLRVSVAATPAAPFAVVQVCCSCCSCLSQGSGDK
jgi:hypothetical protein